MSPKIKNRDSALVWSPVLALLTGALALHSTLVTRANGVWASVHAFVASQDSESLNNDAYMRVLSLWDSGVEGIEVLIQFFGMIILICFATVWLGRYRSERVLVSGQETLLTARPILAFSILIIELAILYTSQSLSVAILLLPIIFLMIHDRNQAVLWPAVGL